VIAVDSSVVIAALLSWHELHDRAFSALEKAMTGQHLLLPTHALVESYSVMTRLPSPHRLRPEAAYEILHASLGDARTAGFSPRKAWAFLEQCSGSAICGGRTYDALIATTAIEAGATELLTLNPRDFEPFGERISIIVP
jgi:predicted nucleic acid-binding protein